MWLVSQFSHNHVTAGKYFPQSPAVQCHFYCTSCAQRHVWRLLHTFPFSTASLLNAPTWQAARKAPHINVDSRAVPVMDASSDVLYDTLCCKLISHGGLWDEHSVTLNKGLSD